MSVTAGLPAFNFVTRTDSRNYILMTIDCRVVWYMCADDLKNPAAPVMGYG